MGRIFVTGDYHGNFHGLKTFCALAGTTTDDILVMLGDMGINYTLKIDDLYLKRSLTKLPITLFGVHGNHEERPQYIAGYKFIDSPFGIGKVWHDDRFPNQFFADNGFHTINDKTILIIDGAYSVDKEYRLMTGHNWFASEQLTQDVKDKLLHDTAGKKFNYVFSHTCPVNYIPRDMFLSCIDQNTIDRSMEDFLQLIYDQITFDKWFCGHWHTDRIMDKMNFLFHDYKEITE